MRKDSWIVGKEDIRPAGPPDKCFYCNSEMGQEHKPECVCRERTVVLDCTVRVVKEIPENWSEEVVNRFYNHSTWCANNIVSWLDEGPDCLCDFTTVKYIGEATEEDEEKWGVSIKQ